MGGQFDLIIFLVLWVAIPHVFFILSNLVLRFLLWIGNKNTSASINGLWNGTYFLLYPVLVLPYRLIQKIHGDDHTVRAHMFEEYQDFYKIEGSERLSEKHESKPLKAYKYLVDFFPLIIFFIIHNLVFGRIQTGNEFSNIASDAVSALKLSNFKEAFICCFNMAKVVIRDTFCKTDTSFFQILWIYVLLFCSSHFTTYAHIRKLYRSVDVSMIKKGAKKIFSHFFGAWFVWQVVESVMNASAFFKLGNGNLWYEVAREHIFEWGVCLIVFMAISFIVFVCMMVFTMVYGIIFRPYARYLNRLRNSIQRKLERNS